MLKETYSESICTSECLHVDMTMEFNQAMTTLSCKFSDALMESLLISSRHLIAVEKL